MTKIAFLGLGAMGSRMAARLIAAGHQVTLWNRTPERAAALVAAGGTAAPSPREAAIGAEMVLSMLRDDAAARAVWLDPEIGALQAVSAGAMAIECSTVTPDWAREFCRAAQAAGVEALEAPVSGSRPQAEAGQLAFLVGGAAETLARAEAVLKIMGASATLVGPPGAGAGAKLAVNALLGLHVAGWAEILGFLRTSGVDVEQTVAAMAKTAVFAPVDHYLTQSMLTRNFAPQFPIELIEKDFFYAEALAGGAQRAPLIAAARAQFRRAIEQGWGGANMTGVSQFYDPDATA